MSDGITSANQTNVVLKGIIGIGAMAKICSFLGMSSSASMYQVHEIMMLTSEFVFIGYTGYCGILRESMAITCLIVKQDSFIDVLRTINFSRANIQPVC